MSVTMMDEIKVYVSKIPKSQITCSPKLLIKNISKHFSQTGLFTRTPEMIEKYHGDEIRELQNSLLLEFGMDKYEVRCICCGALFQDCDCPHSKCAVESCFLL